ncbi:MAG: hypothetical protein ACREH8_18905, partial [Opitutaceae bacterium]
DFTSNYTLNPLLGAFFLPLMGIHQGMNPWNSAATNRRGRQIWGLLIAGMLRLRLADADLTPEAIRRRALHSFIH